MKKDALDFIFEDVMCLPLTVTENSKSRYVRVLGMVWHFFWFVPVGAICLVPEAILMVAEMFRETWKGHA